MNDLFKGIMSQTSTGKAEELVFNTMCGEFERIFGKKVDLAALGISRQQALELIRKSIETGKNLLEGQKN